MLRTKEEQTVEMKCVRGGIGEAEMHILAAGESELNGKGKLFNHVILAPGVSIGDHFHHGDSEIYYILSGEGLYNDNGTAVKVKTGDFTLCPDGEQHGLKNTGSEPMEIMALILYC